jgi:colanic acid/amylovoran/stewartan biosynthesis glycosyltransferase WcaL/AmsK/CpsK
MSDGVTTVAPRSQSMSGGPPHMTMERWTSARSPWALHSVALLGNLTDSWIDLQARSHHEFDSRLLGLMVADGVERAQHWLLASDRPDLWLAYKGMYKSRGLSLVWLARAFNANPPAVVHAHYGTAAWGHIHLARSLNVPLVASFYGFDATMQRFICSPAWKRRYRKLFDEVAVVLAEGPAMAGRVAALGCPEDKLRVVRMPANEEVLADCSRTVPDPAGSFVVVAPGRFVEKKGLDVAIRVFAHALRGCNARLVMLGDGDLAHRLRRIASDEGVEGQVEWTGLLDATSYMRRISSASVAIYSSREAGDGDSDGGAPVTLIESQWLGVPSLVSDHDDLPFVAAPGGAIVLSPLDVDAWAEALRALYEDRGQLVAMGQAACDFARSRHAPAVNAREREQIYVSL